MNSQFSFLAVLLTFRFLIILLNYLPTYYPLNYQVKQTQFFNFI